MVATLLLRSKPQVNNNIPSTTWVLKTPQYFNLFGLSVITNVANYIIKIFKVSNLISGKIIIHSLNSGIHISLPIKLNCSHKVELQLKLKLLYFYFYYKLQRFFFFYWNYPSYVYIKSEWLGQLKFDQIENGRASKTMRIKSRMTSKGISAHWYWQLIPS